ncbi:MAG: hypothetical protein GY757_18935 [bacterium]|nr:hypothetical protein [bacterium]
MMDPQPINEIIQHVKENSPDPERILISFSGGKDSWATWIAVKDHFGDVQPFAYYLVPNLQVVDDYLDECEKIIGTEILRFPSQRIYHQFHNCVYQPPENLDVISQIPPINISHDDVARACEISSGFPENSWTAIGLRSADSIARSSAIKRHGAWNDKRRVFYPVWDWNKAKLCKELKRHDIRLSNEYYVFGRTFDGLYLLYALGLKTHYPDDYKRVLEFFPFVDLEVFRFEKGLKKYGSVSNLPKKVVFPEELPKPKSSFNLNLNLDLQFDFAAPQDAKPTKPKKSYSRLRDENKRMQLKADQMVDPEFWISIFFPDKSRFQIVFEDRDQKEFFLHDYGWFNHGDKYLNGCFIAEDLEINGFPDHQRFNFNFGDDGPESFYLSLKPVGDPESDSYLEFEAIRTEFEKIKKPPFFGLAKKFVKKMGWLNVTTPDGNIYGHDLAPIIGMILPGTSYYYRPYPFPDKKLRALSHDLIS